MNIYGVSDLHIDMQDNWQYITTFPYDVLLNHKVKNVLLIAGDVATEINKIESILLFFKTQFDEVFFIYGNHELYLTNDEEDQGMTSLDKIEKIQSLCQRIGIHMKPHIVSCSTKSSQICNILISPIYCWYQSCFDKEDPSHVQYSWKQTTETFTDFKLCKWPSTVVSDSSDCKEHDKLAPFLVSKNVPLYSSSNDIHKVITFSHFLPRFDLLPKRQYLFIKTLPKCSGSEHIDTYIRSIGSSIHLFGHTHIDVSKEIQNVQYVQNAFGYPSERRGWKKQQIGSGYKPLLIYSVE